MPKQLTDFQKTRLYLWAVEYEELQKRIPKEKGLKQLQLIEEWEQLAEKIQKLDPAFSNPKTKRSFAGEVVSGVAFGLGSGISSRLLKGVSNQGNPKMESFSSALKRNIRDHGFKGAMKKTWQEVKAGQVSPPPKKRKSKGEKRNPVLLFKNLKEGDAFHFQGAIKDELLRGPYIKFDSNSYYKQQRPQGAPLTLERVGSINVKVIKVGEIINPHKKRNPIRREFYVVEFPSGQTSQTFSTKKAAEAFNVRFGGVGVVRKITPHSKSKNPRKKRSYLSMVQGEKRKFRKKRIQRKNPIAIYNPHKQTLLYGRAFIPEIRGIKTNGNHKGERFRHKFDNEVMIYGNPDGSLTVKGAKGVKLWDYEQNI